MSSGSAVPRSSSAASPTRTASWNETHQGCLVLAGSSRSRSTPSASTVSVAASSGGRLPRASQSSIVGGSPITFGARISVRVSLGRVIVISPSGPVVGGNVRASHAARSGPTARARSRHARRPSGDSSPCPPAARHMASTRSSSSAEGRSSWLLIETASGTTRTRSRQLCTRPDGGTNRVSRRTGTSTPIWGALMSAHLRAGCRLG
jgi:hypothetical protein